MLRRHVIPRRRGFVLLAVLWVIVALATLGLAIGLTGRDTVAAAQNRVSLARNHWQAEGCVNILRSVASDALADRREGEIAWRSLDDFLTHSPLVTGAGCELSLRAAGITLDVNAADAEELRRLFLAMRLSPESADSLVDAILDWRDADDEPRPYGAERSWYESERAFAPRNGALADVREIARVRGMSRLSGLDSLLGVENSRIDLGRAPRAVLAALPGFSDELVAQILEQRARDALPPDLLTLASSLSPSARDSLAARYAEVVPLVTMSPDAWIVTARAREGSSPAVATVEARFVRSGPRVTVARQRSWP
jgi:type II secretory pathway component PulK